jgi:Ca-activated chloride channel family protein
MKTPALFIQLLIAVSVLIIACKTEKKEVTQETLSLPKEVLKPSEDVVFVLDVSTSMLAQDFVPNRLEAVKSMLKKMIKEKEPQQQMAIVLFEGEAFVLCPLTKDSIELMKQVHFIETNKMKGGTAIGLGIMAGLYELSKSSSLKKDILILTDGVNNSGEYSPNFASQIANQQHIQIHSFGIGCNGTALCPVAQRPDKTFIFGQMAVEIDEKTLKKVGKQTKGSYLRVTCSSDLENLQSLKSLIENSSSPPIQNKLDSFPLEVLDSLWNEIHLKNEAALSNFNS